MVLKILTSVFPQEFTSVMSLDKGSLSCSSVTNEKHLEWSVIDGLLKTKGLDTQLSTKLVESNYYSAKELYTTIIVDQAIISNKLKWFC